MSGAPLGVPASPSSSKRSRSRDSSLASSYSTAAANTPVQTPSGSTPSLAIPPTPQNGFATAPDPTPYPAFLRLSRADIHDKFVKLDAEQEQRILQSPAKGADGDEEPSPWARCSDEEVASRNRYNNVEPYQGNRVKLQVPEGFSDYINASPIVLESTKSKKVAKYIATQGPKFNSVSHLWRMVWHETSSPAVIIMLTRTHELGREKCCPYFPESTEEPELNINADDEFDDGFAHNLKLVSLTEHEEARAQVRELDMVSGDGGEHKKIWHLLFAGWPDFSVPQGSDRDALLKLIEMSREKNADNESNPRIVHCSAGVGRSGTFIALDWLVQELEEGSLDNLEANEDPIYNVVDNLRKQRMMMVQAEAQLAFLYDVVREHWRERWARLHPEEADRLGLSAVQEPKQKKTKQSPGGLLDEQPPEGDEDEHAQLEAELIDAQAAFEQGKT